MTADSKKIGAWQDLHLKGEYLNQVLNLYFVQSFDNCQKDRILSPVKCISVCQQTLAGKSESLLIGSTSPDLPFKKSAPVLQRKP